MLVKKWKINVDGCARSSEPFDKNKKRLTDYFHWLTSNQRNDYYLMNRNFDDTFWNARKALLNPEIYNSMKFRHLKAFSKSALVVKLSGIHGRGLFTLIDLEQGQMIIEYAGEIIRNQICDKREKFYESKVKQFLTLKEKICENYRIIYEKNHSKNDLKFSRVLVVTCFVLMNMMLSMQREKEIKLVLSIIPVNRTA